MRTDYLDDEAYRQLQQELMAYPDAGDVIEGTGGLRKLRRPDPRRGKGKRGGLRVIYYWWLGGDQFWLFTVYDKDEADDLTAQQRKALKELLKCSKIPKKLIVRCRLFSGNCLTPGYKLRLWPKGVIGPYSIHEPLRHPKYEIGRK